MLRNDLKPLLGEGWKEKFVHRDLWDPDGYGVASFDLGGEREKVLAINFATEDIMDHFYDDRPDDEWISLDRYFELKKGLSNPGPTKYFCNKKYILKANLKYSYGDKLTNLFDLAKNLSELEAYPRKKFYHKYVVPIHIFIGVIFVPNPDTEKYTIINHIDKDNNNFRVDNLEWCDYKWNSKKENKKEYKSEYFYLCVDTGETFYRKELIEKYGVTASKSAWKAAQNNTKYKGHSWKIVNPDLEDYLSRHPLRDDWYQHPTRPNTRANGCGILEINGKLRIGTRRLRYYYLRLEKDKSTVRTHRLIFECFSNRILEDWELIDHIIPATIDDCDNSKENLKVSNSKENMNNPLSVIKHEKRVVMLDLLGNPIKRFDSIKKAVKELSLDRQGVSTALFDKALTYKGYFWIEEGREDVLEYKQSFIYTSWNSNRVLSQVGTNIKDVIKDKNIKKKECHKYYQEIKKYLNTGMPAPDGFYYQQGDPQHMLYNPENKSLVKIKDEVKWESRRTKARKRRDKEQ